MTEHPRLGRHQQPTLPLVQMRKDHLELRRKLLPSLHHDRNTTATTGIPRSYDLFLCMP
jgi:hypothetical protein